MPSEVQQTPKNPGGQPAHSGVSAIRSSIRSASERKKKKQESSEVCTARRIEGKGRYRGVRKSGRSDGLSLVRSIEPVQTLRLRRAGVPCSDQKKREKKRPKFRRVRGVRGEDAKLGWEIRSAVLWREPRASYASRLPTTRRVSARRLIPNLMAEGAAVCQMNSSFSQGTPLIPTPFPRTSCMP